MAVDDDEAPQSHAGEALRTAASAAIAGAAVGAAQAFAKRRHSSDEVDETDDSDDSDAADEREEQPAVEHDGDGGATAEPDVDEQRAPEESETAEEPVRASTSPSRTREIVERAREQLRDLRGADAETVSSIRRTPDGWRVGLDIVEVHRIPESTDLLATYELDLDGDGNLITFERTARYHRSEADRR